MPHSPPRSSIVRLHRPKLLHVSVQESLKAYIADNRLASGAPLPPEGELAARLGVSRGSVREAIRAALSKVAGHDIETSWSMAGPIPGDPDWAGGKVYKDIRQIEIDAPADAAFRAVCRVGGGHGWYAADWLWKIRGWLDLLVGGPGLRRGRRDPERVGFGEALDFWRVVGIEQNSRLALRAEMKLPGEALLEFRLTPTGNGHCVLEQQALFIPHGLMGLLYWYAVVPFHAIVFKGMLNGIRREAFQIANTPSQPQPA